VLILGSISADHPSEILQDFPLSSQTLLEFPHHFAPSLSLPTPVRIRC
jgi:hypothetical protein